MALHQVEGAVETRPRAQPLHERPVGEAAAAQEECRVAAESAEKDRDESLPRYEHALMREEAGEDRRRLAFGHAGDEHGDQAILLDQGVDGVRHCRPNRARATGSCSLSTDINRSSHR